jgi:methionine-rich copper-binding protein CopC
MRTRIFVLPLLVLGLTGSSAHAHAMLASASPPVGGSVGAAPRQVTLSFTQGLEPAFSSVQVTDSKGARVDTGKAQVGGSTMSVGLKSLAPEHTKFTGARCRSTHIPRKEASPSMWAANDWAPLRTQ